MVFIGIRSGLASTLRIRHFMRQSLDYNGVTGGRWLSTSRLSKLFSSEKKPEEDRLNKKDQTGDSGTSWGAALDVEDQPKYGRVDGWTPMAVDGHLRQNLVNQEEFDSLARTCLKGIFRGLESCQEENTNMRIVFDAEKATALSVFLDDTEAFKFTADLTNHSLIYRSPEIGATQYSWYPKRKRWLSIVDGHEFEGILTRDLMRRIVGVPHFSL